MNIREDQAQLNIVWQGYQGDLPDPIPLDMNDAAILEIATEAVRNGSVPGIPADPNVRFVGYRVDRRPPEHGVNYNRVFVRNETAFG